MDPRNTFSKTAERYWKSTDHMSGPDLDYIRKTASEIMPSLMLDVATGAGHALRAAAPFSSRCAAVDITIEMISVAMRHLACVGLEHVSYIAGSAESLPVRDSSADLLICRIACHHFQDLPGFLAEVKRVLTARGRFVIIDSVVPNDTESDNFLNMVERIRDPSHVRSGTLAGWRELFMECGLLVEYEDVFERRHPFDEWVKRAGVPDDRRSRLVENFKSAPDNVREKFRIEFDNSGKVLSYTDQKAIFAGTAS